jgi:hypothetical protein
MKILGWVSTGVMTLMLGASTVVLAQDKPDEVKPAQQEEPKRDEAKPERRPAQEPREQGKRDQDKRDQDRRQADKAARDEHPERQGANARPAGKSQRIPDDKFRQHFGREHVVVINRPVIVEGQPRFQSGGYWFVIVDPWPVDWVYTDDCYIDFVDGEYFLFDVLHPGVRVALFVTL